ncbi:unnamed protein product [Closterium sp. NIES-54]
MALLDECVEVYLDDILIYSRDMKQHIKHLRRVFQILRREKFYVKLSKSEFALKKVQFLGHMVSAQGVHVDPKKIEAVRRWKTPENVKEIRGRTQLPDSRQRGLSDHHRIQDMAMLPRREKDHGLH